MIGPSAGARCSSPCHHPSRVSTSLNDARSASVGGSSSATASAAATQADRYRETVEISRCGEFGDGDLGVGVEPFRAGATTADELFDVDIVDDAVERSRRRVRQVNELQAQLLHIQARRVAMVRNGGIRFDAAEWLGIGEARYRQLLPRDAEFAKARPSRGDLRDACHTHNPVESLPPANPSSGATFAQDAYHLPRRRPALALQELMKQRFLFCPQLKRCVDAKPCHLGPAVVRRRALPAWSA